MCGGLEVDMLSMTTKRERGAVPVGRFLGRALHEETSAQVCPLFVNPGLVAHAK
jgi:hypothetical protein